MNEAPGNPRHRDERAVFARDQQDTPDRLGRIDVFSGSESAGFADIIAEFTAGEKRQ